MKLRLRDNSVRVRLMQGEVDALASDGRVSSSTCFPGGGRLVTIIAASTDAELPAADFADGVVHITLPERSVSDWAGSDQVSIVGDQPLDGDDSLKILVEKDFACLAPREGEDESDMFPHPSAGTSASRQ